VACSQTEKLARSRFELWSDATATGTAPSSHMTILEVALVGFHCSNAVNSVLASQSKSQDSLSFCNAASDGDRVALQSMRFATPHSAGATCMTVGQLSTVQGNGNGALPKLADAADDQVHI